MVVVRSTWDYHRRLPAFLDWVTRASKEAQFFNDPATVRWNSRKTYLADLQRSAVPTVPTVWGSAVRTVREVLEARSWSRAVLKPAVGADAEGATLLSEENRADHERLFTELRSRGEVLIQPYLAAVERPGERSLVFLDGTYSHAALRKAAMAPERGPTEGTPVEPTAEEIALGERAVACAPMPPLYARVDLVPDAVLGPVLIELELIEPFLFLSSREGASERLARAIVARLAPSAPDQTAQRPRSGELAPGMAFREHPVGGP